MNGNINDHDDEPTARPLDLRPLIVTARMDNGAQATFDALRRAHFPPDRNWLAAHVTLFHALPGSERSEIEQVIGQETRIDGGLSATVQEVRFTGNGVSFGLDSSGLKALRGSLAGRLAPWLTRQDQQGFRPHVTIQNKVPADVARALHAQLTSGFKSWTFAITGLDLWHYDGGPWVPATSFPFRT
jgi:hypothetical protein